MRFLKKVVAILDEKTAKDLEGAKSELMQLLLGGISQKSREFQSALKTWRKAWKNHYGFNISPEQEQQYFAVQEDQLHKADQQQDEFPQEELKQA